MTEWVEKEQVIRPTGKKDRNPRSGRIPLIDPEAACMALVKYQRGGLIQKKDNRIQKFQEWHGEESTGES